MPFYVLYEPANKHPQYFTLCKTKEKVVKTKSQMDQKLQNLLQILSPFFGQWDIQSNDTAIQGVIYNTKLKLSCNLMFFPIYEQIWVCFNGGMQNPNVNLCISCVDVYILCSQAHKFVSRSSLPFLHFRLLKMGDTDSFPALHLQSTASSPQFLSPLECVQT